MTARQRRSPSPNRYWEEFRTILHTTLNKVLIRAYCFKHDHRNDQSIRLIILLHHAATAAEIENVLIELDCAFDDIDNTAIIITVRLSAFAAMTAQRHDDYDDDDDDDDDDDNDDDDGDGDGDVVDILSAVSATIFARGRR